VITFVKGKLSRECKLIAGRIAEENHHSALLGDYLAIKIGSGAITMAGYQLSLY
jgi:hypothetical protein